MRLLAGQVYALRPEMLNDARNVTWTMDIYADGAGRSVELRPNLTPDPRFYYRRQDVPAASHPPLAACMARLAGRVEHEIIWDPFCGSGLELIECALLGGVERICGTDRSAAAIAIARGNFAAAKVAWGAAGAGLLRLSRFCRQRESWTQSRDVCSSPIRPWAGASPSPICAG